jgi:hypothetical protein
LGNLTHALLCFPRLGVQGGNFKLLSVMFIILAFCVRYRTNAQKSAN